MMIGGMPWLSKRNATAGKLREFRRLLLFEILFLPDKSIDTLVSPTSPHRRHMPNIELADDVRLPSDTILLPCVALQPLYLYTDAILHLFNGLVSIPACVIQSNLRLYYTYDKIDRFLSLL